jgi:hypothetical protein
MKSSPRIKASNRGVRGREWRGGSTDEDDGGRGGTARENGKDGR